MEKTQKGVCFDGPADMVKYETNSAEYIGIHSLRSIQTDISEDRFCITEPFLVAVLIKNHQPCCTLIDWSMLVYYKLYTYWQTDGVTMGSPLGPVLADVLIGMLEGKAKVLKEGLHLYGKSVDDIIVMMEDEQSVDKLVDKLNTMHTSNLIRGQ